MRDRAFYIRAALIAALAVQAALTIFVIVSRIGHRGDLEWMTGAVLDHMERVREGKPIYTAPSAQWIPLLYPPLYYYVGAALGGGALAGRFISVASTIAQGALVWSAARALGAPRFWSTVSVLILVASFSFVGTWFDLERSDNLFGALILTAAVVAMRAERSRGYVAAGALFALAALAKQQAIFYIAGTGLGLVLATRASDERVAWRNVVIFGAAVTVPLSLLLVWAYAGDAWAAYYIVKMPKAHGVLLSVAPRVFARDFGFGFLLVLATIMATVAVGRRLIRERPSRRDVVGASILGFGFAGAVASRLHTGGWFNVLIPWTGCAAVAVGVVASRIEDRYRSRTRVVAAMATVIVAQMAAWLYDPRGVIPSAGAPGDEQRLVDEVRALEREGEVLLPARCHITRVRHFHISALADVASVQGHSPADLKAALRERAYAAVIDDARFFGEREAGWPPILLEDLDDLRPLLLSSYYVARHIDYGRFPIALFPPATPMWVYRPRRAVLDVDAKELRRRQIAEMRLAEKRSGAIARGESEPFSEDAIEDIAARELPP